MYKHVMLFVLLIIVKRERFTERTIEALNFELENCSRKYIAYTVINIIIYFKMLHNIFLHYCYQLEI